MSDGSSAGRLAYRGDIEGLRAVAILLVVAAHAQVPGFSGGFVGVDVFFVLSGYLISGLLISEIKDTGTVDFARFYVRRFRRLLPALVLMLVVTALIGALLLAPDEQRGQAMSAASAAMWMSNFFFGFADIGYFSPGAETNLFLHTWSLGVEEQFYLVWPLLLVLVLGASRIGNPVRQARRFRIAMIVTLVLSFALCAVWTWHLPNWSFYLMPARAWQFAVGALVYLATTGFADRLAASPDAVARRATGVAGAIGWTGLLAIVFSAVALDPSVPYPGVAALLPSIGAAAVIAAGALRSGNPASRLLSTQPMQTVGHISYTWYLWHWPVLLLGATLIPVDRLGNRLALAAASAILAGVAYRLVEVPIRRNRRIIARPSLAIVAALALMVSCSFAALRWDHWAADHLKRPDQQVFVLAKKDAPKIYAMGCDDWYRSSDLHPCTFGPPSAKHTAVLMGDSIGLQWFPAVADIFSKPGWRLVVLTKSSCPMVDEPLFYVRIGRLYTECATWRTQALEAIAAMKPDVVLLGSTYIYNYTDAQWQQGTERVLQAISAQVGQIRILRSTPALAFDGPNCLARRSWLQAKFLAESQCSDTADDPRGDAVFAALQRATRDVQNARVVDMTGQICPDGVCRAERNGMVVFRDTQHLTASFARSLAAPLAEALDAP